MTGRLCLLSDLRTPNLCPATTGIGGISIEVVGGATTTSADDGSFSVASPGGSIAKLRIAYGGDDYRDVLVPVGLVDGAASGLRMPLVTDALWDNLLTTVGVVEPGGSASIISYFVKGSIAATGVEVQSPSGTTNFPIYDRPNDPPDDWIAGALTGPRGAAIMVGVPAGSPEASFLVIPADSASFDVDAPVEANALTFVTVALP
jgi:hypothetical protein